MGWLGLVNLVAIVTAAIGIFADSTRLMAKGAVVKLRGLGKWVPRPVSRSSS
jgi:hypothetical protein